RISDKIKWTGAARGGVTGKTGCAEIGANPPGPSNRRLAPPIRVSKRRPPSASSGSADHPDRPAPLSCWIDSPLEKQN
ncbi:MAG: hypothetical protein K0U74_02760, partial [Alphaproteobacteria bacterium]|nr:hypothetical protein [Alphaproteobacteria bacterium]